MRARGGTNDQPTTSKPTRNRPAARGTAVPCEPAPGARAPRRASRRRGARRAGRRRARAAGRFYTRNDEVSAGQFIDRSSSLRRFPSVTRHRSQYKGEIAKYRERAHRASPATALHTGNRVGWRLVRTWKLANARYRASAVLSTVQAKCRGDTKKLEELARRRCSIERLTNVRQVSIKPAHTLLLHVR